MTANERTTTRRIAAPEFIDTPFFPDGFPLPDTEQPLVKGFFDACKEGRLVMQSCNACGAVQHPPEVICHTCHGFDLGWWQVSGYGRVWTHATVWNPAHPALRARVPYNVCLVQLDDEPDVYLLSPVIDTAPDDVYVGMPVQVVFERTTDDVVQPRWKRRTDAGGT